MRVRRLLAIWAIAGLAGCKQQMSDAQGSTICSPEDCTADDGSCVSCDCDCNCSNEEAFLSGTAPADGAVDIAGPWSGTNCMGDPCQATYQNYKLPAGCQNQSEVWNDDSGASSWLKCQQGREPIRSGSDCGGKCPPNIDYLWGRLNQNCAGDYCGGSSPADCVRCLVREVRGWLGNEKIGSCGPAATCMNEILSSWYPGNCTKKCNSAAPGTTECTHAWMECSLNGQTYYFDGNNGIFYSCP